MKTTGYFLDRPQRVQVICRPQQSSAGQDVAHNPLAELAKGLSLIGGGVMMFAQGVDAVDRVLQQCGLHSNS